MLLNPGFGSKFVRAVHGGIHDRSNHESMSITLIDESMSITLIDPVILPDAPRNWLGPGRLFDYPGGANAKNRPKAGVMGCVRLEYVNGHIKPS